MIKKKIKGLTKVLVVLLLMTAGFQAAAFAGAIPVLELGQVNNSSDGQNAGGASVHLKVAGVNKVYTGATVTAAGGNYIWNGMVWFQDGTGPDPGQQHVVAVEKQVGGVGYYAATTKTITAQDIANPMGVQFQTVTLAKMAAPTGVVGTDKVTLTIADVAAAHYSDSLWGYRVYESVDGAAYQQKAEISVAQAAAGYDINATHGHTYKYKYKILTKGKEHEGAYYSAESASFNPNAPVIPAPSITSMSHDYGSVSGGLSVTLTGTNFTAATCVVKVGGNLVAANITAAQAVFTMPSHAAGIVIVRIEKQSDASQGDQRNFTYLENPVVSSCSPSNGPAAGGTPVDVNGTYLVQGKTPTVKFGGTAASVQVGATNTKIAVTTPAHAAGSVTVEVDLGNGVKGSKVDAYTYDTPPPGLDIQSITPTSCVVGQTPAATISGTGFNSMNNNPNAKIRFNKVGGGGTTEQPIFVVNGNTQISLTIPGGLTVGKYDVQVTDGTATDALASGFEVLSGTPTLPYGLIDDFENGSIENSEILTQQQAQNVDWYTWNDNMGTLSFTADTTPANVNNTKGAKVQASDTTANDGYLGGFGIYTAKDVSTNANLDGISFYVANTGAANVKLSVSLIDDDNNDSAASQNASYEFMGDDEWVASVNISAGSALTKYEIPFSSFTDKNSGQGDGVRNFAFANNGGAGLMQVHFNISSAQGASVVFTIDYISLVKTGQKTPTITSVDPIQGIVGTEVTITGTNFESPIVKFGTVTATGNVTSNATQIKVKAPQHNPGTVDIIVINNNGTGLSATKTSAFTYITVGTDPVILGINPTTGKAGDTLTISGANLVGSGAAPEVYFGATANATTGSVKATITGTPSNTSIAVTVPSNPSTQNAVDVFVKRSDGKTAKSPTKFTYKALVVLGNLDIQKVVVDGSTVRNNDYINKTLTSVVVHVKFKNNAALATGNATLTIGSTAISASFSAPATLNGATTATLSSAGLTQMSNALQAGKNDIVVNALSSQGATADIITYSVQVASTSDQVQLVPLPDGNLLLNYPNPFNPNGNETTDIAFALNKAATVSLYIYDLKGTLILKRDISANAGYNTYTWNGRSDFGDVCGTGAYFYRLAEGNRVLGTGKLTIINK